MARKSAQTGRLAFIDGLRGIAACMVMFYHLGDRAGMKAVTQWGYLGVGIFFVLSGFVIASTLLDKPISGPLMGRFFARRFVRLDIPYWVNIAATVALGALLYRLGGQIHHYTGEQIGVHLVYLQGILGVQPINQVYWTLCLEIQFYIVLVLLLWLAQKIGGIESEDFQIIVLVTLILSLFVNVHFIPTLRGVLSYWWAFAFGAMTCWWRARKVAGSILALTIALTMLFPLSAQEPWRVTAALTVIALVLATTSGAMGVWLANPVAQFLGRISYSLYLFHALIGWEAQTMALRYVGSGAAFGIGITVSVLVAWIAYLAIERPAIRLSHHIPLSSPQSHPPYLDTALSNSPACQ